MNTLTFVLVLYVLIGFGTGIFAAFSGEDWRKARVIGWPLIWPLVWFMVVYVYLSGRGPAKCIWCGKTVASMHKKDIEIWRDHYVDECQEHPLKLRLISSRDAEKRANEVNKWLQDRTLKVISALRCALHPTTPSDYSLAEKMLDKIDSGEFLDPRNNA